MNWFAKSLIVVVLIFAAANIAGAECPIVSPDSTRSFAFALLDTLANPVARASGDSMWIFTYYPSGGLAFADSVRLLNGANLTYRQTQIQGRLTAHFSYSRLISAIDGTAQNGPYEVWIIASDSSLALQSTFHYCFDERLGGLDSIGVDGTQFANGTGYIDASVVADDAIDAGAIAASAIGTSELATGAITSDEIAQSAGDEIGFYTWNMGDDSAGWTSGADTSMGRHINWLNPSENFGINWGDISNPGSSVNLSATSISTVSGNVNADVIAWNGAATNGLIGGRVDANIQAAGAGVLNQIADTVWRQGLSQYRIDANYTTAAWKDSTMAAAFTGGAGSQRTAVRVNIDSSAGDLADAQIEDGAVDWGGELDTTGSATSVWNHGTRTLTSASALTVDANIVSVGGDAIVDNGDGRLEVNAEEWHDTPLSGTEVALTLQASLSRSVSDSVWWKGYGWATQVHSTAPHDTTMARAIKAVRDSGQYYAQTGASSLTPDSIRDIIGDTFNVVSGKVLTDAGDSIRAHAPHGNNWATSSPQCGSGSQAVTIYVIDTSGTDELVTSFVTIYNSAQTSIVAFGTASGGIGGTYGLTASTAYKGLATANGYYFPLYSFTTGSGASHTDTIRGYDVPTSAGSAIPSSHQVQLYDWAITPTGDTLFGARVAITLVGSSNFYTSSLLVPSATVITYAGQQGTASAGKWQATIFNTDSLMAPGGATPTYHIEITNPVLDVSGSKIVYSGVRVPYSAAATRLRTLISQQ